MLHGFEQTLGHGFVVLAGVANVGKDLGQCLLVVQFAVVAVLFQVLFIIIIGVDGLRSVVVVGLAVDKALQGQTVGEGRLFGRPAYRQRGDGHDEAGQTEDVDNLLGHVDGGAQIAVAQPLFVHEVAERLRVEQGVRGGVLVAQEVVVARLRLAVAGPDRSAVEVGTDGQHHRSTGDHGLIEMGRCQPLLHLLGTGDDDAVELQVAHGLCTCSLRHQAVQQRFAHFLVAVLADGPPGS